MAPRKKSPPGQLRLNYRRHAEPRHLSFGSLFSGIGGLELGLGKAAADAGIRAGTSWQVESNPYSRAVLAKHYPLVPRHNDVRTVSARCLTRVDWLVGGSPCQEISKSAYRWARTGMGGERSGLWSQFARLIEELQPDLVVWENVGGALCVLREGREVVGPAPVAVVLKDLDDRGYDAWWTTALAAGVGAKHLRLRVFVVAWRRRGPAGPVPVPSHFDDVSLDIDGNSWPAGPREPRRAGEPRRWIAKSSSVPFHMERLEALGNAVVPQCAYAVGVAALALHARMRGATPVVAAWPPRSRPARTPRAQGAALAAAAIALVTGRAPYERFATFEGADDRWADCRGARGAKSELCRPWPGVGVMINGELRAAADAPTLRGEVECALGAACDGSDPVDGGEIALWPTPTARDWRSGKASEATRSRNARPLSEVAAPRGFLEPTWVDELMGFSANYTLVEDPGFPQRKRGSKLE